MDDNTKLDQAPTGWEPHRGVDGKIQISVRYYDRNGRVASGGADLRRYLELLGAKALKWQRDKEPCPDYNPTRERAAELLREEDKRAEAGPLESYKLPPLPAREELVMIGVAKKHVVRVFLGLNPDFEQGDQATPQTPLPKPKKEEPARAIIPKAADVVDVETLFKRLERLTDREKEVARLAVEKGDKFAAAQKGLGEASVIVYVSDVCKKLGMPKSNHVTKYNRRDVLRQVFAYGRERGRR